MPDLDTHRRPSNLRRIVWLWLRIPLAVLALLLVVGVGAVSVVLASTTLQVRAVERIVTVLTDRPFHIRGDFELSLGSEISVAATQVEWDNPTWSSTPYMLAVSEVFASVNLASLLTPPVVITNAKLTDARLEFEWSSAGQDMNWMLGPPAEESVDEEPESAERNPLPLLLDKASLSNVTVRLQHPALTEPLVIEIIEANQQQDEQNRLVLTARSLVDGREISLDGRIGPFPELIVAGAVDFAAKLVGPNAALELQGDIDSLLDLAGTDFEARWTAPKIEVVLDILNLPQVTEGASDLKARLQSDGTSIEGSLRGVAGTFDIDAEFNAANRNTLDGLHIDIASTGPSAMAAGAVAGIDGLPDAPYEVRLKADDSEAGINISELHARVAGSTLKGTGLLRQPPGIADADIDFVLTGENLNAFQGLAPALNLPALPFSAAALITSNGTGVADSFSGSVVVGEMRSDLKATLIEQSDLAGSTIDFSARIPEIKTLAAIVGTDLLKSDELNLSGKATISADRIAFDGVNAILGDNRLSVNGSVPIGDATTNIKLDGKLEGPDASLLFAYVVPPDDVPALPFNLETSVEIGPRELAFTNTRLQFGQTNVQGSGTVRPGGKYVPSIALNFSGSGDDLDELLKERPLRQSDSDAFEFAGRLELSDRGVELTRLQFNNSIAKFEGSVSNGWPQDPAKTVFDVRARGSNLRASLPDLSRYTPAAVPFQIDARGEFGNNQISIEKGSVELGDAELEITGEVQLQPEVSVSGVEFSFSGDKLSDLGTVEGWQTTDVPFSVTADASGSTNTVNVRRLKLTIGQSDVSGDVSLDFQNKPQIDIALSSRLFDLTEFISKETSERIRSSEEGAAESTDDGRLIPDYELPTELLNQQNISVRLETGLVKGWENSADSVLLDADLVDGYLNIQQLDAAIEPGTLASSLSIKPVADTYELKVNVTTRDAPLPFINTGVDTTDALSQKVDLYLESRGTNLRDIAGRLDGFVWYRSEERQIENFRLGLVFGDFIDQLFRLVNPFSSRETTTNVVCTRLLFEATDGRFQTTPAVLFRTDRINTVAVGYADMKTEKIDFGIESSARTGLGISAGDLVNPFIRISGTLNEPRLALDPTGTIIQGSAAVLTAGLSIVAQSLYRRWLNPGASCQNYTNEARTTLQKTSQINVPAD